jgi:hypothetical protein
MTASVPSTEPSSTTICSQRVSLCCRALSRHRPMKRSWLYVGVMMETRGALLRGSASRVPASRCAAAAVRRARAFCHPMAELGSSGLASGLSRKVTSNRNADRGAHASSRRVARWHRRSEPTSQSARPTQRRAIVALAALPYHSDMSTVATRCCPRQLRLAEPVDGRVPPDPVTPRTRRVPPPPLTPRPHTRRATQPFGTR